MSVQHSTCCIALAGMVAAAAEPQAIVSHRGRAYYRQVRVLPHAELTFEKTRSLVLNVLNRNKDRHLIIARFCTHIVDCEPPQRPYELPDTHVIRFLNEHAPSEPRRVAEVLKIGTDAVFRYRGSPTDVRTEVLQGTNPLHVTRGVRIVHLQFWAITVGDPIPNEEDEALDVFAVADKPIAEKRGKDLFRKLETLLRTSGPRLHIRLISWFPFYDHFPIHDPFEIGVQIFSLERYQNSWWMDCQVDIDRRLGCGGK